MVMYWCSSVLLRISLHKWDGRSSRVPIHLSGYSFGRFGLRPISYQRMFDFSGLCFCLSVSSVFTINVYFRFLLLCTSPDILSSTNHHIPLLFSTLRIIPLHVNHSKEKSSLLYSSFFPQVSKAANTLNHLSFSVDFIRVLPTDSGTIPPFLYHLDI